MQKKKSEAKDLVSKKDFVKLELAKHICRQMLNNSRKIDAIFYKLLSKGLKIDEIMKEIRTYDNQRDISIELVKKAKINKKMKGETK